MAETKRVKTRNQYQIKKSSDETQKALKIALKNKKLERIKH